MRIFFKISRSTLNVKIDKESAAFCPLLYRRFAYHIQSDGCVPLISSVTYCSTAQVSECSKSLSVPSL